MFERITIPKPRRRWGRIAVAASIAGHIGVGLTLLIAAFWQIDKLNPDHTQAVLASSSGPPSLTQGGAPPPPPPKNAIKRKSADQKIKVKGLRQPSEQPDEDDDVVVADADPSVPGHEQGIAGSRGNNIGSRRIAGPGGNGWKGGAFDTDGVDSRFEEIIKKKEKVVPAHLIRGHRIAGNPLIQPPKPVALLIKRSGVAKVMGMIKMCLSPTGVVRSLRVIKSTGYGAYDAELKRGMRSWRYRPYTANGRAISVCTVVTFVYRPQ